MNPDVVAGIALLKLQLRACLQEAAAAEAREAAIESEAAVNELRVQLAPLEQHQIWHALVQDYEDLQSDPQLEHLGAFVTATSATGAPIALIPHPARYDGKAPPLRRPPPSLGQHTGEVLGELGYDAAAVERLRESEAVGPDRSATPFERKGSTSAVTYGRKSQSTGA